MKNDTNPNNALWRGNASNCIKLLYSQQNGHVTNPRIPVITGPHFSGNAAEKKTANHLGSDQDFEVEKRQAFRALGGHVEDSPFYGGAKLQASTPRFAKQILFEKIC